MAVASIAHFGFSSGNQQLLNNAWLIWLAGSKEVHSWIGNMSPEAFSRSKKGKVTTKSDIWTVGCMMLELLTGDPAFLSYNIGEVPDRALMTRTVIENHRQWVSAPIWCSAQQQVIAC